MPRALVDGLAVDGTDSGVEGTSWQGWLTLVVVATGVLAIFANLMQTEFVMIGMLLCLVFFRVLDTDEATQGFGFTSVLTVMVLMAMAEGIFQTGALEALFRRALGRPHKTDAALVRMCLPVAACCAFVDSAPVMALMPPLTLTWSRGLRLPASQFVVPLGYAAKLGGACTLLGAAANLLVQELYDVRRAQADAATRAALPDIWLLSQARFGVPIALAGIIFIACFGAYLVPSDNKSDKSSELDEEEPVQVGMMVTADSPAVGQTAAELGLASQHELKLTHINRDGVTLPVHNLKNLVINVYDELYFTGDMTQVDALAAQLKLTVMTDEYDVLNEDDSWAPDSGAFDPLLAGPRPASPPVELQPANPSRMPTEPGVPCLPATPAAGALSTFNRDPASASRAAGPPPDSSGASTSLAAAGRAASLARSLGDSCLSRSLSAQRLSQNLENGPVGLIRLVHVTVKDDAPIAFQTIKQVRFRTRFNAAVVDLRRGHRRVRSSLGQALLKPGDQLMLDVGATFDFASPDTVANFADVRQVKAPAKQFMMALEVIPDSNLEGKSLEEAGLRGMGNAFVSLIQRGDEKLHAVGPTVQLMARDILWVAGNADAVFDLRHRQGLRPYGTARDAAAPAVHREIVQAALSWQSPYIGQRVHDANFDAINATLLAVHRSGICLPALSDVRLQAGDVLLLESSGSFLKAHKDDEGFALLSVVENSPPVRLNRSVLVAALLAALVAAALAQRWADATPALGLLPLAAAVVGVMLLARCLSPAQLHKALRWDAYITLAAAVGVAAALEKTRAAAMLAQAVLYAGRHLGGDTFAMAALYAAAALLANAIPAGAAAALLFPVAANLADGAARPLDVLAYVLMFGASAAYVAPHAAQPSDALLQPVGGASAADHFRFGAPLQAWQALATLAVLAGRERWWIAWLAAAALAAAVFVPVLLFKKPVLETVWRRAAPLLGRRQPPKELRMDGFSENERYGISPALTHVATTARSPACHP